MEVNRAEMSALVDCKKCKSRFKIGSGNITFDKRYENKDGQSIWLTYFDCPDCQERHYVQIDNLQSRELKKKVQRNFIKLSVLRKQNKFIPKQQQDKFNKMRKSLEVRRFELMKQYEGSVVTDTETGEKTDIAFVTV